MKDGKGFVASCCTLSASCSSGLGFLETKAGLQPRQGWLCCATGRDISCGCSSSVLQFPSSPVVTSHGSGGCGALLNYT